MILLTSSTTHLQWAKAQNQRQARNVCWDKWKIEGTRAAGAWSCERGTRWTKSKQDTLEKPVPKAEEVRQWWNWLDEGCQWVVIIPSASEKWIVPSDLYQFVLGRYQHPIYWWVPSTSVDAGEFHTDSQDLKARFVDFTHVLYSDPFECSVWRMKKIWSVPRQKPLPCVLSVLTYKLWFWVSSCAAFSITAGICLPLRIFSTPFLLDPARTDNS